MILELEGLLRKEGLTANASKDGMLSHQLSFIHVNPLQSVLIAFYFKLAEIKAVKKRKEKLKDLEGIDTSNIIEESSRGRRSRSSANSFFAPPPQRKDPVDSDEEDEDEDEDEAGDEDDSSEGGKCLIQSRNNLLSACFVALLSHLPMCWSFLMSMLQIQTWNYKMMMMRTN